MNTITACAKVAALLLVCHSTASAQVSSSEPNHWKSASPVGGGTFGPRLERELRDAMLAELLDSNIVDLIAQSIPLSFHERTLFQVAPDSSRLEVWLYRLGDEWSEGCGRFAQRLGGYFQARMDGHTRACLLAGLTNRTAVVTITDPELQILCTNYPMLPVSLFHKAKTGATTNKAGLVASRSMRAVTVDGKLELQTNYTRIPQTDEVCHWVSYTLVDGDIGWSYTLFFAVGGTLDRIDATKLDAKDLDPKFRSIMEEVDADVMSEMKQNGTSGKFGAIHTYWQLKKERLKARGVEWRSPAELNHGRIYD